MNFIPPMPRVLIQALEAAPLLLLLTSPLRWISLLN